MKVAVLGAGTWGTVLSNVLDDNSHTVTLWHYKDDFIGFVRDVHDLAGDVLITSPNDFKGAHEVLSKLAS